MSQDKDAMYCVYVGTNLCNKICDNKIDTALQTEETQMQLQTSTDKKLQSIIFV